MFGLFGKKSPSALDALIDDVTARMDVIGSDDDKYAEQLAYLERLIELRDNKKSPQISRDTIVTVTGNLLGVLIIVAFEQKHVMNTKALGSFIKPK